MAAAEVTPRISPTHLGEFQGRHIRMLGKVTSLRGEQAEIEAGGASCTVQLTRDAHLAQGTWVEVIGKVNPDLSVKALLCTDWGTEIDAQAADAVVDVTHRYKALFYD